MMNTPHHPEARFQTPAELIAHYKAVAQRIDSAALRFQRAQDAKAREISQAQKAERENKEREHLARIALSMKADHEIPAKALIARVAEEHGLTYADVVGERRKAEIVKARFAAIRRVHEARPHLSLPQLGMLFGERDHTTILNALRRSSGLSARQARRR